MSFIKLFYHNIEYAQNQRVLARSGLLYAICLDFPGVMPVKLTQSSDNVTVLLRNTENSAKVTSCLNTFQEATPAKTPGKEACFQKTS